jgi:tetraacyldisaccharide 4'-kinase
LTKFTSKLESVLNGPSANASPLDWGLKVLSMGYGAVMKLRNYRYASGRAQVYRLPCPVVSVGNLSVGGTGKTPMTVFLSQRMRQRGLRCVVLSRGYKGSAERCGGLVSDGQTVAMSAEQAGDEPFMMACSLPGTPVRVGRDRYEAGLKAFARFHPDIIILDDGFQHRRLYRDLDVVLMDAFMPFGNGHLLPRGILREPPSALSRAHLVVLTRSENATPPGIASLQAHGIQKPVFVTKHTLLLRAMISKGAHLLDPAQLTEEPVWERVAGRHALLFSGIAKSDQLEKSLRDNGLHIVDHCRYADHHAYDARDVRQIDARAVEKRADLLVTTHKDYVRLGRVKALSYDLLIVDAAISFLGGAEDFIDHVWAHLQV